MYRCHFTRDRRIVAGDNLEAATLEEAIREGHRMLAERAAAEALDGFEVWEGAKLLHKS